VFGSERGLHAISEELASEIDRSNDVVQWFQRRPRRRGKPGRRRGQHGDEGGCLARRSGQDVPVVRAQRAV
jgi:hypothetical protein